MVNCYKCGKFSMFGANYDGLCENCYKDKIEEERKIKEKQKKEREIKEREIKEKLEAERRQQIQEKRKKTLEIKRERKRKEKEEEKEREEKEKNRKEELQKLISQKMISNPNMLLFYKHIFDINKNVVGYGEDGLINSIVYKVMANDIFVEMRRTNFYSNTKYFNEKFICDYIYNFYTKKELDNGFLDLYEKNKKLYNKEREKYLKKGEYEYRYEIDEIKEELSGLGYSLVNFLATFIAYLLNLSNIIKEFSECKDLETMHKNLRDVTDDIEYIRNKLYPIYQKFYEKDFKNKLSKEDFGIIIALKENLIDDKKINIKLDKSKLKTSLINFVAKEYGKIIKVEESKYICIIGKILSNQNDLEPKKIFSIINNLDEILLKINQKACLNEAKDERTRLLSGDVSKEIEMKKLSLDFNNIENGFAFEEYVANLYKNLGFTIETVTKKSGDQGADVIAYKDNLKYVIQAKFYTGTVGNKAVQEVVASMSLYKADKGIVITNSSFTMAAMELAVANKIELVDGEKIEQYIQIILKNL